MAQPPNPAAATSATNSTSGATQTTTGTTQTGSQKNPAAPTPAEVRKLKLKLEGQEVELPESEVISLAQQGKVANKRFQEASQIRKEAEDIVKFAKENPREFFKKTGMNAREFAENYLMEELKREQMTPAEKKAYENEQELKRFKDEKKQEEEQRRQQEMADLREKHMKNYDQLFVEALTKTGLPKTPYTIKRMAELQLINVKNKLDLSADQLAKVVREDYISEQKALFGATEGDSLLELLGPEIVKKLSKAQIARLKSKGAPSTNSSASGSSARKPGEPAMTWREYQRRNRRLP